MPEDFNEDEVFEAPHSVDSTSDSPSVEPSSTPEALAGTDAPVEEVAIELPQFDPRYHEAFEGLLFIGQVEKEFRWLGHRFLIKSPHIDDLLEIGQLHKAYANTVADIKAYQALMIASVLVSVDGQGLPIPLSDSTSALQAKFEYIRKHWYPWTLDKLYDEYMILDGEVLAVHEALGKA